MDLTTTYLGLALRNPLVASASPLSQTVIASLDGVTADGWVDYATAMSNPTST